MQVTNTRANVSIDIKSDGVGNIEAKFNGAIPDLELSQGKEKLIIKGSRISGTVKVGGKVAKVGDFGLVKNLGVFAAQGGEARSEDDKRIIGTPETMAPEAVREGGVSRLSDIYSLAVVAYFLLTGKPIFDAESVAEYVVGALLALTRPALMTSDRVVAGDWPREQSIGTELAGKQLGLVGLGSIARRVAVKAGALGMLGKSPFN